MPDVYDKIAEARKHNIRVALCTVVNTKGSTPRKIGAKMLVDEKGQVFGTIGGGELERNVIGNAFEQIRSGTAKLFRHDLLHQHNMCCGGTVDVLIEPIFMRSKLYIFGAGHTGSALAEYAADLSFEIFLVDNRKEYLASCKKEGVNKVHLPFAKALQLLPFDEHTFVCIMTYSHAIDRDILLHCMKQPSAYLGMIGSRRKVEVTKRLFMQSGLCEERALEKVDMPMGMDIGAEGPHEIALSILAKVIEVKNSLAGWKKELRS
ncbi:MAG: XdhC family protein [Bacteroidota bacterium]